MPDYSFGFNRSMYIKKLLLSAVFLLSSCVGPLTKNSASIIHVIDGDTVIVRVEGKKEKVRLIGIDAPEVRHNDKAGRDSRRSGIDLNKIFESGKAASNELRSILSKGDIVGITYDLEKRDRYGRLLAYLYFSNGTMINEEIVRRGFATPLTIAPNTRFAHKFRKAAEDARKNSRGLWRHKTKP